MTKVGSEDVVCGAQGNSFGVLTAPGINQTCVRPAGALTDWKDTGYEQLPLSNQDIVGFKNDGCCIPQVASRSLFLVFVCFEIPSWWKTPGREVD